MGQSIIKNIRRVFAQSGGSGGGSVDVNTKELFRLESGILSESYGDSITVGSNSTSGNSYIELTTSLYSFVNTNRAVSSRGIWEAARLHNLNINSSDNKLSIVMAGFNDVRRGGNDVKTFAKIENGYKAIIVNQFAKTSIAANSGNPSITTSGSFTTFNSDVVGGKFNNGLFSTTNGSYLEYTFRDNNVVLAMIGADGVSENYGTFDIHINGVLQGSYDLNGKSDNISDGSNSNNRSPFILTFNVTDGVNVIRVTNTSSLPVPIDYFGHLKKPNFCTPLILMHAPKMNNAGYATSPSNANDTIIEELNDLIDSVANDFSNYPLVVGKTNDFYDVTTGLDTDNIHPNDLGHRQIYNALYDAMKGAFVIKSSDILSTANTFTNTNDFNKRITTNEGLQVRGALTSPSGAGFEAEYAGGTVYLTAYNRSTSSWLPKILRGSIISIFNNGTKTAEFTSSGLKVLGLTTHADNAAAIAAGLTVGAMYIRAGHGLDIVV